MKEIGEHDIYHTYDYHRLMSSSSDDSILFRFSNETQTILLPFIIRKIPLTLEIDATSVYGYTGPLVKMAASSQSDHSEFKNALKESLRDMGIVCLFSRLHPIIDTSKYIEGLGSIVDIGTTVSIDLKLEEEEQWGSYRKNTRYEIRKLIRDGFTVRKLDWNEFGAEFIEIYQQTMRRVGASQEYYFSDHYYSGLFQLEGVEMHLFGCFKDGKLACAGLFSLAGEIIQYHLSGTAEEFLKESPSKLMIDAVRCWAKKTPATILHLGGGVGGKRDSLFKFKAGLASGEHTFRIWKWILNQSKYEDLTIKAGSTLDEPYFPAYRKSRAASF
ncbi:GNAT family N-acetyltransferase [Deinococcus sp. 6YEL10]|uniref:GNAT family N-acetyltransferase n=1 Tax=Deinococcus sp. 6YEL10 TaxID=2745870 RepID=UPI001E494B96|nr:GNAT family N-acetyltransferase [Deinococcus sp. 6YEL10]